MSNSKKKKSYKAFLEPEFRASQVNRQTYQRWMTHVTKGNTILEHSELRNEEAVGTLTDLNQRSQYELNTTAIDVSSNENEDTRNWNEIIHDENSEKEECDRNMSCNDEMENNNFVTEDDFNLFVTSNKNYGTNDDTIMFEAAAGPKFSHVNITKYAISKKYNPPNDTISYIFYCEQCYKVLLHLLSQTHISKNKNATCHQCGKRYQISNFH
ncbi:uncharacterized protein LOC105182600 isoform X2 [Harpegnathos saltator]|uniref:uncharacterized protein LOC105182600 isoform X2 n=1 Tax=Harpegnathos saltator TaxID=610380 RepID=UPI000DBEDA7F|nr:uncharacterized protein LOC105182600 isoform X2 [Harpegnathos saltator]